MLPIILGIVESHYNIKTNLYYVASVHSSYTNIETIINEFSHEQTPFHKWFPLKMPLSPADVHKSEPNQTHTSIMWATQCGLSALQCCSHRCIMQHEFWLFLRIALMCNEDMNNHWKDMRCIVGLVPAKYCLYKWMCERVNVERIAFINYISFLYTCCFV